ncbi:hypothetical protein DF185_13965 [Marinifilum breve]|uniref:Uncharacterized protein n=1 Tax=Marinifilum breve TaxID=2184082 RepID=A0A2V3ZXQ7_9BACT|nr:hypothetical protein [Marinifilum breve]PXX98985.1 hypothetical protein DF185_13965 [Marinifilum breve]
MKTEQMKRIKLIGFFIVLLVATQSCVVSSLHPLYTDSDRVHLDELDGVWIENDEVRYEITTIVDTTDMADMLEKMESVSKLKHKVGSKLKVKYKDTNNVTVTKDSITGQFVVNGALDHKQIMHYLYPDTRKHYQIKTFFEKDTSIFDAVLSKLNGNYFLDVIPNDAFLEEKLAESPAIGMLLPTHMFFKIEVNEDQLVLNSIEPDDFKKLLKSNRVRVEYIERDDNVIITAPTEEIQKFLVKFADSELFNEKDKGILKRIK